jgi:hypothetical protein
MMFLRRQAENDLRKLVLGIFSLLAAGQKNIDADFFLPLD